MKNFKIKDLMITIHPGKNSGGENKEGYANVNSPYFLNHAMETDCFAPTKCGATTPDCYAPTKCGATTPDCYAPTKCGASKPANYSGDNIYSKNTEVGITGSMLLKDLKKTLAGMKAKTSKNIVA